MSGIVRQYEFPNSIETPTQPAAGTPSADSDLVSLGYVRANFARSVATVAALKGVTPALRSADLAIYVAELLAWFVFDSASTATGNDISIITPTDAPASGRWFRLNRTSTFSIANNQSSPASVTGLLFDKTKIRSVRIEFQIFRTATAQKAERGTLLLVHDGTNWDYALQGSVGDSGVTLSVNTSTGQVLYASDNMAGSYNTTDSVMKYSVHPWEI